MYHSITSVIVLYTSQHGAAVIDSKDMIFLIAILPHSHKNVFISFDYGSELCEKSVFVTLQLSVETAMHENF